MTFQERDEIYYNQAPCYLHPPNDGAKFRCDECKELFAHNKVIQVWTPNRKPPKMVCLDCVDEHWFKNAKKIEYIDPTK